jgi:hypothetical protein
LDLGCHAERVVGIFFLSLARGIRLTSRLGAVGLARVRANLPQKCFALLLGGNGVSDAVFSSLAADAAGSGVHGDLFFQML